MFNISKFPDNRGMYIAKVLCTQIMGGEFPECILFFPALWARALSRTGLQTLPALAFPCATYPPTAACSSKVTLGIFFLLLLSVFAVRVRLVVALYLLNLWFLNVFVKIFIECADWYSSVGWVSCKPKGHWFESRSGHSPGLCARCPVGGACERQPVDVSLSLSPSLLLSENK